MMIMIKLTLPGSTCVFSRSVVFSPASRHSVSQCGFLRLTPECADPCWPDEYIHDANPLDSYSLLVISLCARTDALVVCGSMSSDVISLPVATSSENSQALAEVSHFGLTDMGYTGQGPWTYRILHDPALSMELAQMSRATTLGCVDIITLQPCPPHIYLSQDRYVVEEWDLPGGAWQFNGVFDGNYMQSLRMHDLST
jgi:hypothetical protein